MRRVPGRRNALLRAVDVGGNFVDVYRSTNDGWVYEFSLVAAIPRNPSIVIGAATPTARDRV
ncbi:MAG: hypothetical protein R3E12_20160 [Candidatus Eisenbacteria bacterium]